MRRSGRFPRFSRRDAFERRARSGAGASWWRSILNLPGRSGALKFSGRTPTAMGSGREDVSPQSPRGHALRSWCAALVLLLLLLSALNAARRESLGNQVPWPAARPLRIFDSSLPPNAPAGAPSTWARARLVGEGRGWGETFWALPTLCGEWSLRLAPPELWPEGQSRGAAWAIGIGWLALALWWCAALALGLKRPSLGLGLLLLAQGFGASYWLGSRRAPIRRIETASTCRAFDFGARTVRSGGMLSGPESIEWHRARGFSGLALDEGSRWWSFSPSRTPSMILLPNVDLQAHDGTQRRLLLPDLPVGLSLYSNERTIWAQAGEAGALAIGAAPWSAPGPPTNRELASVSAIPAQAIEAWSGSVGDEDLARQWRARGLPIVGGAGSGVGSDCFVWTLLPADARTPSQVITALRQRRVAVAYALLESETPQNLQARAEESRRPGIVLKSWREAMSKLSPTQKLNVWLQVLALALALLCWGARPQQAAEAPSGPQTAMKFLRRKRLLRRANGLAVMALAFAGSAWAVGLPRLGWSALAVLLAWLALDALYLLGRMAWKRMH